MPRRCCGALGARLLQAATDLDSNEDYQVYADPAGHPFCIGWGHHTYRQVAAFLAGRRSPTIPHTG